MQVETDKEKLIAAAVDYQVQYLKQGDLGILRDSTGIDAALAALTCPRPSPRNTQAQVDNFRAALTALILQEAESNRRDGRGNSVTLATGCNPQGILKAALAQSGAHGCFPDRDRITIDFDEGTVTRNQINGTSNGLLFPAPSQGLEGSFTARLRNGNMGLPGLA